MHVNQQVKSLTNGHSKDSAVFQDETSEGLSTAATETIFSGREFSTQRRNVIHKWATYYMQIPRRSPDNKVCVFSRKDAAR